MAEETPQTTQANTQEINEKYGLNPEIDFYEPYTKNNEKPEGLSVPEAQDGYLGHLTDAQKQTLKEFRDVLEAQGIKKERLDTLTLLRFLRARKFDIEASKKMYVDFNTWRDETMLDHIVPTWNYSKESEQLFQYYPQYYHGTDKDGRPVYIERYGKIDLGAMRNITTDQRMLDNLAVEYEKCAGSRLPATSQESGHLVETFCTIMDMDGVSFGSMGQVYAYVKQASAISQNYYPERLGKLYIINAPWTFTAVWSTVKGLLDPVTVKKISILGSGFKKELLQQIPAYNLPERFGGTCRCNCKCEEAKNLPKAEAKAAEELCKHQDHGCGFSNAGPWQNKDLGFTPWYETDEAKAKATEALKGTSKEIPADAAAA